MAPPPSSCRSLALSLWARSDSAGGGSAGAGRISERTVGRAVTPPQTGRFGSLARAVRLFCSRAGRGVALPAGDSAGLVRRRAETDGAARDAVPAGKWTGDRVPSGFVWSRFVQGCCGMSAHAKVFRCFISVL